MALRSGDDLDAIDLTTISGTGSEKGSCPRVWAHSSKKGSFTRMAILFVRHRVSDYRRWRRAYEDAAQFQQRSGVRCEAVYLTDGEPNDVTVMHEFASVTEAQAFVNSVELRERMAGAGVLGVPALWITNQT
jgi:hypothetical protein